MRSTLTLILLLAVSGCSSADHLSAQPSQAEAQILLWIPVGTAVADAQSIMEKHHFTCSTIRNGKWGSEAGIDYLYCDYTSGEPFVKRRWQAALILVDNKVSSVSVSTALIGL